VSVRAAERTSAGDERGAVLTAFARALRRESHVLREQPELLWQQLYNRLQWAEEPVPALLEPKLRRRSTRGTVPRLRAKGCLSVSGTIRFSPAGPAYPVTSCTICFGSDLIVGSSYDGACRIWDVATGREQERGEG
jgi:hypothetical protein